MSGVMWWTFMSLQRVSQRGEERLRAASRGDAGVTIGTQRQNAEREVGGAGVAEPADPGSDGGLISCRQQVTDIRGIAPLKEPLVVR